MLPAHGYSSYIQEAVCIDPAINKSTEEKRCIYRISAHLSGVFVLGILFNCVAEIHYTNFLRVTDWLSEVNNIDQFRPSNH